jgi:hypothetical protein
LGLAPVMATAALCRPRRIGRNPTEIHNRIVLCPSSPSLPPRGGIVETEWKEAIRLGRLYGRCVIPADWQPGNSSAIAAFRYLSDDGVLQIAYVQARLVYDFPCPPDMYQQFLTAPSRGRFVQWVMRPYARRQGWSRLPYPWPW